MLLGTFAPKLDDKGRVILPAKFRDQLASGIVITRGQERCLYVFSERPFDALPERPRPAPAARQPAGDFPRLFLSGANEERPDSQNRITIPVGLREYAGLSRELTVVGAGDRAEIWDTETWNQYYASVESDYVNTGEEVIPGLF
mgnify:CR=1 FL=1